MIDVEAANCGACGCGGDGEAVEGSRPGKRVGWYGLKRGYGRSCCIATNAAVDDIDGGTLKHDLVPQSMSFIFSDKYCPQDGMPPSHFFPRRLESGAVHVG